MKNFSQEDVENGKNKEISKKSKRILKLVRVTTLKRS